MQKEILINVKQHSSFEKMRKVNDQGRDYWFARELQIILGYAKWEKFQLVLEKAKQACMNSEQNVTHHFLQVGKMVDIGSGTQRDIRSLVSLPKLLKSCP